MTPTTTNTKVCRRGEITARLTPKPVASLQTGNCKKKKQIHTTDIYELYFFCDREKHTTNNTHGEGNGLSSECEEKPTL